MSRAMNVTLAQAEVTARCAKAGAAISAIETLPDGGTRVVLVTSQAAETMRDIFAKHLIETRVKRFAFMHPRPEPLG